MRKLFGILLAVAVTGPVDAYAQGIVLPREVMSATGLHRREFLNARRRLDRVLATAPEELQLSDTPREALAACGLPHLVTRLDEIGHWAQVLSPGEAQRIAFARALVQRPEWLFLDEATSALDEASEAELYRLLRARLPGTTIVSISHRSTLGPFHTRHLQITRRSGAPGSLEEVAAGASANVRA